MRQQGLEVPFDDSEYTRQLAELRSRQIDAEIQRSQANHDLRRLLGLSGEDPDVRLWPSSPLIVAVEPLDAEAAVSAGLAMRPEIRALRQLTGSVNEDTLPAINKAMQSINGLLGMEAARCAPRLGALLGKHKARQTEVPLRRQQLAQYTSQQEQQLSEQIRSAVAEVDERLRQIALAKETAGNWQQYIATLRAKSTTGQSTFVDIGAARLKSLDADGDVIHAVAAWEIARVKLAELQGRLIAECADRAGGHSAAHVEPAIRTSSGVEPILLPQPSASVEFEPVEPPSAPSEP
jgi:outer membrane protein TolC